MFSVVVYPQPEEPRIHSSCPCSRERERSFTTSFSPNRLHSPESVRYIKVPFRRSVTACCDLRRPFRLTAGQPVDRALHRQNQDDEHRGDEGRQGILPHIDGVEELEHRQLFPRIDEKQDGPGGGQIFVVVGSCLKSILANTITAVPVSLRGGRLKARI